MSEPHATEEEAVELGLPIATLDHIFQARNPKYYQNTANMEHREHIYSMILEAIADTGAGFDPIFKTKPPLPHDFWISLGEDGFFISHFTYFTQEAADQELHKKSVFFIGKFEDNKKDTIQYASPVYYLFGQIEVPPDADGQEILFPIETGCRCRLPKEKQDSFGFAVGPEELMGMLCYGRTAFEMILAKQRPSVDNLEHWLTADDDMIVQEFRNIEVMTADEFETAITLRQAAKYSAIGFDNSLPSGRKPS